MVSIEMIAAASNSLLGTSTTEHERVLNPAKDLDLNQSRSGRDNSPAISLGREIITQHLASGISMACSSFAMLKIYVRKPGWQGWTTS